MKTYEVLEKALALIEDEENWSRCGWGEKTYCISHAIEYVTGVWPTNTLAWKVIDDLIPEELAPGEFNDIHPHAEVVALFKQAIASEKQKAGVYLDIPEQAHVGERVAV